MAYLLLRYGEIFLKGKNQHQFLASLLHNIHAITGHLARVIQSRIVMDYFDNHESLRRVFGLGSYSICEKVGASVKVICPKALEMVSGLKGTFRVETKRSDKRFPMTSLDLNRAVGEYIENHSSLCFSLKNADIVLYIEINEAGAFLFMKSVSCCGGLPVGCEGRVGVILEDEYSVLAGITVMRRGCSVFAMIVGSAMVNDDISLLQKFSAVPLKVHHIVDWAGVDTFILENRLSAVVSSSRDLEVRLYPISSVVLHPLVCEKIEDVELLDRKYHGL